MKSWPYVYPLQGSWWTDTGVKLGPRKRKRFGSEAQARDQATRWRKEYGQGGTVAFLTDEQRLDAVNAIRLYEKRGITDNLLNAVTFYCDRHYPKGGDSSVGDAIDEYKKEMARKLDPHRDRKISQIYFYSLNRLERLRAKFGATKLSVLDGNQVLDSIYDGRSKQGERWSNETRRQHFRYYRMFFKWCTRKHLLHTDPFEGLESPTGHTDPPQVLWREDIQKLLDAAWPMVRNAHYLGLTDPLSENAWTYPECDHRFFLYFMLGTFCGIRPYEISRLKWENFSGNYDWIKCTTEVSKTHDVRNFPVPLNANLMLQQYINLLSGSKYAAGAEHSARRL